MSRNGPRSRRFRQRRSLAAVLACVLGLWLPFCAAACAALASQAEAAGAAVAIVDAPTAAMPEHIRTVSGCHGAAPSAHHGDVPAHSGATERVSHAGGAADPCCGDDASSVPDRIELPAPLLLFAVAPSFPEALPPTDPVRGRRAADAQRSSGVPLRLLTLRFLE